MIHIFKSKDGKSRGESAGSAAAFVAIITVLIIMYILFLPPDMRDEILGDKPGGGQGNPGGGNQGGGSAGTSSELFKQKIGRVDFLNANDKRYELSSVRIYSPTSGEILKASPSIAIRNGLFDKENSEASLEFTIDKKTTKNVMLSFSVKESRGPSRIYLNGDIIHAGSFDSTNPKPMSISSEDLNAQNTLTFKSLNPGWIFWSDNRLVLENVQITGDVTDFSRSTSTQYFTITTAEINNIKSMKFYFSPGCKVGDAGILNIELNGRMIYSSIADCGVRSSASLDTGNIKQGTNEITFSAKSGSYLLDTMYMLATFDKPAYNTYFFDMKKDYFYTENERARCGEIDDECPPGCSDTEDADCCFRHNGFWCGLPTYNPNDRCVFYVGEEDCDACPTGFYDKYDDPPKNCEGRCGDNDDGICPSSCLSPSKYYDADCCWEENPDFFYCQDMPITGLSDKCKASIRPSDCKLCPSVYEDEGGSEPDSCDVDSYTPKYEEDELLGDYDVEMIVRFIDDTKRKRVDLNLNGYKMSIDTNKIEYRRLIDDYVREGTNTIEIIPKEDIDIAEIRIELVRVR